MVYAPLCFEQLQRYWQSHSRAEQSLAIEYLQTCPSTNQLLCQRVERAQLHNTLLIAERQTHGQGQFQRQWHSVSGDLLWSLGLSLPRLPAHGLPLQIGWCIATVLRQYGYAAQLKWPNDIVITQAGFVYKLAGILVQTRPIASHDAVWCVMGVGLNIATRPLDSSRVSAEILPPAGLQQCLRQGMDSVALNDSPIEREIVLMRMVDAILQLFSLQGELLNPVLNAQQLQQWHDWDVWRGKTVQVWTDDVAGVVGQAKGVNAQGQYVIQTAQALHVITHGRIREFVAT